MRKNILHRDRQLRMMLSGIAHEIRNPLGGMELFAGILEKEGLSPKELEYVKKIKTEIQNLKRLLNEFLEFAGPKKMMIESFDISGLIAEIHDMMDQDLREKRVRWSVEIQSGPDIVAADRSRIKQALLNLYRNAAQAVTSGGDIRSVIALSHSCVSIELSNTQQHSLPPEIAEKIFEPFYTTKEKGIGLGLPMAKQVVEAHGGTLSVSENTENQITFVVQLPVALGLQSNTPPESEAKAARSSESPLPLQRSQSA